MISTKKNSLIITLKIDDAAQIFFNEKRMQYYPAYANFVDAHITLFHKLPSDNKNLYKILNTVSNFDSFSVEIIGITYNENFVAYNIFSSTLQNLHATMQKKFIGMLHEKDKEILNPHITVHNKATVYKAYKVYQKLIQEFEQFSINAIGITTWLYAKKEWIKKEEFLFKPL